MVKFCHLTLAMFTLNETTRNLYLNSFSCLIKNALCFLSHINCVENQTKQNIQISWKRDKQVHIQAHTSTDTSSWRLIWIWPREVTTEIMNYKESKERGPQKYTLEEATATPANTCSIRKMCFCLTFLWYEIAAPQCECVCVCVIYKMHNSRVACMQTCNLISVAKRQLPVAAYFQVLLLKILTAVLCVFFFWWCGN